MFLSWKHLYAQGKTLPSHWNIIPNLILEYQGYFLVICNWIILLFSQDENIIILVSFITMYRPWKWLFIVFFCWSRLLLYRFIELLEAKMQKENVRICTKLCLKVMKNVLLFNQVFRFLHEIRKNKMA